MTAPLDPLEDPVNRWDDEPDPDRPREMAIAEHLENPHAAS